MNLHAWICGTRKYPICAILAPVLWHGYGQSGKTWESTPDAGVRGNTHFPMSGLNNWEVAAPVASRLQGKGLDRRRYRTEGSAGS